MQHNLIDARAPCSCIFKFISSDNEIYDLDIFSILINTIANKGFECLASFYEMALGTF